MQIVMKQIFLNLFPKGKNVIKALVFFLLFSSIMIGQKRKPILPHYDLIKQVVAQDTVIQDWQRRIFKMNVENGKLLPKDTITFINEIKTAKLRVSSKSENEYFKRLLLKMGNKNNQLAKDIGLSFKLKMLNQLPIGYTFEDHESLKGIELVDNPSNQDSYHSFSTPLEIEKDVYLVFWVNKGKGSLNATSQLIKYSIDTNGEAKIIGYYLYSIS